MTTEHHRSARKRKRNLFNLFFSLFTCHSPARPVADTTSSNSEKSVQEDIQGNASEPPPPLPQLSQPSALLTPDLTSLIHSALPALARGRRHWCLLYSTQRDGISLQTLYRSSLNARGHCLLVASDSPGCVFGAVMAAPLRPSSSKKYQGDAHTFVFTTLSGAPRFFRTTGANRYYVLCTNEILALGGGAHFALYLDTDLESGSSGQSETFGNTCLATSEEFTFKHVELWGFQHAHH